MKIIITEKQLKQIINESCRSILNEGSDILYHFTDLTGLMGIVEDNEFELTNNREETEGGNVFSFSRTKSGGYGKVYMEGPYDDAIVRLTIDGRRLNQRYKTYPINDLYMYPEDVLGMEPEEKSEYKFGQFHWPKEKPGEKNSREFEYEDRLVTKEETIPNASSYITRVDIYFTGYCDDDYAMADFLEVFLPAYAGRIHIYDSQESFFSQNPKGEVPMIDFYKKYWIPLTKIDISEMPDEKEIKAGIKLGKAAARKAGWKGL